MRPLTRTAYILVAISLLYVPVLADEVRVAFDHGGNIMTYTSQHESRFNLFPDVPNLIKAELYQLSDSDYSLEILYEQSGSQKRQRRSLTLAEVTTMRDRITLEVSQRQVSFEGGDARAPFLIGTTTLGLVYYGWAIPASMGINSGSTTAALYMLISGASFYYPYWITQDQTVTPAMSRLALYGGTRGIAHGIMLALVMNENADGETMLASAVGMSLVEMTVGYTVARNNHLSTGTVESIAMMGDLGLLWGWGSSAAFDMDGASISAMGLMGSALGIASGGYVARTFDLSVGDVRAVQGTALLGALAPISVASLVTDGELTNEQVITYLVAGSAAGTIFGLNLNRGVHFSEGRGNLILLSGVMGSLTGVGFAYAFNPETENATPYLLGATAGGALGYYLMYRTQLRLHGGKESRFSMQAGINPLGLVHLGNQQDRRDSYTPPLATVSIRF